jgi:manganese transport protein
LIAIIPALIAIIFFGEQSTGALLVFSQVILSLQLSFAVIPLVMFTSDRRLMGEFVNPRWLKVLAIAVSTIIVGLNVWLLFQTFLGWLGWG